jgi:hypothetical protein
MAMSLLGALSMAVIAGELPEPQLEQIDGNYQTTYQNGSNNQATIEQSAVAAGLASPGLNVSVVEQHGDGNQTDITQTGNALNANVNQDGNDNTATITQSGTGRSAKVVQSGEGLEAKVEQSGNGPGVDIFQSGVGGPGNGPIVVRQ